jgi:ribosomal protein S18 acetylase RimI-like enzyme
VAGHAAGAIVLVAVMAGRVVGTVTYVGKVGSPLSESTDPDAADIRMLAVAPGAAGRGIGTALVVRCIDLARAERRRRLLLLTRESMLAAQRIYGRLGFVRAPWMDKPLSGGRRLLGYALELGQS